MPKHHCPIIIDIEASGFGPDSYPIEVGVADHQGRRFSRLIKPMPDWQHWSQEAQHVHGISRRDLHTHGVDAVTVAVALNEFLAGKVAYSDGWVRDQQWLDCLYYTTRVRKEFQLSPLEALMPDEQLAVWDESKQLTVDRLNIQRHRASTDALIIQQTFLFSQQLIHKAPVTEYSK